MKYYLFILIFLPNFSHATPKIPLPEVSEAAKEVLELTKEINPLYDCFTPQMFYSQDPKQSALLTRRCIQSKASQFSNSSTLPSFSDEGQSFLKTLQTCWSKPLTWESLKSCF